MVRDIGYVLVVLSAAVAATAAPVLGGTVMPVEYPELEASFVRSADSGVLLRVAINNHTSSAIWVNKRMLWNSSLASATSRELTIEVVDSDGHIVPYSCKINAGAAGVAEYVLLAPMEFVGKVIPLDCVVLRKGERYRVSVHYKDSGRPSKLAFQAPVLDRELTAATLELTY